MPIRNPFAKREPVLDENVRPGSSGAGFEKADTLGSRGSSALSIGSRKNFNDENIYKMSVVNDGVYLPPSPPEKKSFFSRHQLTTRTSSSSNKQQNMSLPPIEPFSISRESFDSYRRSFDISARTPLSHANSSTSTTSTTHNGASSHNDFPSAHGRQSLDSRMNRPAYLNGTGNGTYGRSSMAMERPFNAETPQEEKEGEFEDVMLDRERLTPAVAPKKSFFARLGEKSLDGMGPVERTTSKEDVPMTSGLSSRFHFLGGDKGRKRGQSGGAQELGAMERPIGERPNGANGSAVENQQEVEPTR